MGRNFDQVVDFRYFKSLKVLEFNCRNKKIKFFENLPNSLEELYLRPEEIRVFDEKLPKQFPRHLKVLEFHYAFNEPLTTELPQTLKIIRFGSKFDQSLPEDLPDSIEEIALADKYKKVLPNKLPKSLKELKIRTTGRELVFGDRYYHSKGFLHKDGKNLGVKLK